MGDFLQQDRHADHAFHFFRQASSVCGPLFSHPKRVHKKTIDRKNNSSRNRETKTFPSVSLLLVVTTYPRVESNKASLGPAFLFALASQDSLTLGSGRSRTRTDSGREEGFKINVIQEAEGTFPAADSDSLE